MNQGYEYYIAMHPLIPNSCFLIPSLFVGEFFGVQLLISRYRFFFVPMKLFFLLFPFFLVEFGENIHYLAAFVVTAILADGVRINRKTAMRALRKYFQFQGMMGSDAVPLPFCMLHSDYHATRIKN